MRFYTEDPLHYCGIDLHARFMYVCVLNREGEAEGGQERSSDGRDPQARVGPRASPHVRHALAAQRRGHPADPGVPRARKRETTMVYTHVVKELRSPAQSPLDNLHSRAASQPEG
jgi:hypothetical protein